MDKKIIGICGLLFAGLLLCGCVTGSPSSASSSGIAQSAPTKIATSTASGLSTEQDNLQTRLKIVNNPSTTMWIYGLGYTGNVIFESTVKGKVTSSLKRLDPIQGNGNGQVTDSGSNYRYCSSVSSNGICSDEIIQADGTFGSSDSYVFWFDYEGNYFQWDGNYILSSKPLLLPTPTINFQQKNESA